MKRLFVEDFAVLRGSLESGRQSPSSIAFALLLSIFLQVLFYYLTYYVAANSTIYPNIGQIQSIHFWVTAVLVFGSLIYSIPFVYNRSQKIQYLLGILVVQNIGAGFCYLCSLFLIGEGVNSTEESLIIFTKITLLLSLAIFTATCIRIYILLRKGLYRKGSKKDELRSKFEKKSFLPLAIIGSIGLVFILQYVARTATLDDLREAFVMVAFLIIFYTMIFVLPEQIVILYCKSRFKSFNFNKRGYLESED